MLTRNYLGTQTTTSLKIMKEGTSIPFYKPNQVLCKEKHYTEVRWAHQLCRYIVPNRQWYSGTHSLGNGTILLSVFKKKKLFHIGKKENCSDRWGGKWSVLRIFKSIFRDWDFFDPGKTKAKKMQLLFREIYMRNRQKSCLSKKTMVALFINMSQKSEGHF